MNLGVSQSEVKKNGQVFWIRVCPINSVLSQDVTNLVTIINQEVEEAVLDRNNDLIIRYVLLVVVVIDICYAAELCPVSLDIVTFRFYSENRTVDTE